LVVVKKDQEEFKKNADFCVEIPDIEDELSPILSGYSSTIVIIQYDHLQRLYVDQPKI